jgi:Phage integrase central domain/Arm DNA-binding domain
MCAAPRREREEAPIGSRCRQAHQARPLCRRARRLPANLKVAHKAWLLRYIRDGKPHAMGLGSAEYVSLKEAREKGYEARRQLIAGIDPLEAKRERLLAGVRHKTFKQCALDYVAAHEDGWRGNASRRQWLSNFEKHVFPVIGDMPVIDVDVVAVLAVLDPMSKAAPEGGIWTHHPWARPRGGVVPRGLRNFSDTARVAHRDGKRRRLTRQQSSIPRRNRPGPKPKYGYSMSVNQRVREFRQRLRMQKTSV